MMPMIATTISSSMSVKPLLLVRIFITKLSFTQLQCGSGPNSRGATPVPLQLPEQREQLPSSQLLTSMNKALVDRDSPELTFTVS
jgi:hypothetical protein